MKVIMIMLVSVGAVSTGEAMLSRGMKQTLDGSFLTVIRSILTNGYVVGGTALMIIYFLAYMYALRLADFSFVLPLTAISYFMGALLAKFFLHEVVSPAKWLGTFFITVGVIIVGVGSGAKH